MLSEIIFWRIALAVFILGISVPVASWAQGGNNFKAGDRVEYKDKSYPVEVWKEGTVVKVSPEYGQVVVRWDPRDDYPSYTHNGVSTYEQAYSMNDVRPIKPRTAENPAADNGAAINAPVIEVNNKKTETAATTGGTGLMSKQEILGYMRTHGYANGQPKHDPKVCKDLIEMMKKRGVKEPLVAGTDDLSPIADNGCYGSWDTDVSEASVANLGAPATIDWLAGTWSLTVFGDAVYSAPGDGYIYRQGEKSATVGSLTINADGTFTWKVNPTDPPGKYVKGTWRKATAEEMKLQGGTGIVLQHAAEGRDWIVFKYQSRVPNKAERIDVQDLQYRGAYRRIGYRH